MKSQKPKQEKAIEKPRKLQVKIAVAGCKHTTKDLILGLERAGFSISHCITISPKEAEKQKVAGYMDLAEFLKERKIPFTIANNYGLKSEYDKKTILALDIGILLVMGWQRLIPDWFLENLKIGAFGMHGSSKPLPHGRGRSPMNWSLIQNKDIFYTHLFKYEIGVDDGPIVGVQTFDINQFDTCLTLHFKNTISMIKLCEQHLQKIIDGTVKYTAQPKEGATYYPKRSDEDGLIYWNEKTLDIYNLIRAVTMPFPGAFSYLDSDPNNKIMIWEAYSFDTKLKYDTIAGEIVEVFYNGMFVVKTKDSSLLVTKSQGHEFGESDIGRKFSSLGIEKKKWENLPK